jgi:hypothetical protein
VTMRGLRRPVLGGAPTAMRLPRMFCKIPSAWALLPAALVLAACDAGIGTRAPSAAAAADRPLPVRVARAAFDEPMPDGDACVLQQQRSTSDASGRRSGFTMPTVRCAAVSARPARKATVLAARAPALGAAIRHPAH